MFNFDEVQFNVLFFFLLWSVLSVFLRKSLPSPVLQRYCPMISSRIFSVLEFMLRAIIHVELNFVYGVRYEFHFSPHEYLVVSALSDEITLFKINFTEIMSRNRKILNAS